MLQPAAERPLRTVLTGFGLAGGVLHAPLIAAVEGLELVGAVTRDPGRRAALSADHPSAVAFASLDAALSGGDVDLVVVVSPNRFHVEHAAAAIDAGAHVVVDKPLAVDAAAARAVVERAGAAGVVLSVFHNRRWDDDFLTLARVVGSGALGSVLRVESRFDRWRPELKADAWREGGDPADGGGLLLDLGSHLVDQAIVLLGPVVAVYAELDVRRPGAVVEDDVFLALEHAGGARSHLWAGMHAAHAAPRFRVLGSRGALVSEGLDPQEAQLREGRSPRAAGFGARPSSLAARVFDGLGGAGGAGEPVAMEAGRWLSFYEGVVAAVRDGAAAPVSGDDAVGVLEILDAARESATRGTVVALPR